MAKEMLAGIIGAEVDKLAETKGLDFVDRVSRLVIVYSPTPDPGDARLGFRLMLISE